MLSHDPVADDDATVRHLRAKVASNASWANTVDRSARTANARAAMDAKFLAAAEGDEVRANHLRQEHYARLALKSVMARRAKKKAS